MPTFGRNPSRSNITIYCLNYLVQFFHISCIIESNHLLQSQLKSTSMNINCLSIEYKMNIKHMTLFKTHYFVPLAIASILLSSCSSGPNNSYAYITNQGDNTVSVVNTTSNQVINTIKV